MLDANLGLLLYRDIPVMIGIFNTKKRVCDDINSVENFSVIFLISCTDGSGQTVQTQIRQLLGLKLFVIPLAAFGSITLWQYSIAQILKDI